MKKFKVIVSLDGAGYYLIAAKDKEEAEAIYHGDAKGELGELIRGDTEENVVYVEEATQ